MKHLYLRGLIMGIKGKYKQAYEGFSNVLKVLAEIKDRDK